MNCIVSFHFKTCCNNCNFDFALHVFVLNSTEDNDCIYAKVGDARALASVIGEDELSPLDKRYLVFGKAFESEFVGQSETENRSITETLDKGWELLGLLPKEELDRIDTKILDKYYHETVR